MAPRLIKLAETGGPTSERGSPPGIQSLEIGIRVLSAVASFASAATLTEIANSIDMDLSTCRRYLVSLLKTDMVRQERDTGKYDLGPHLRLLGLRTLVRNDRVRLSMDRALSLNRELDITVIVSVWGDLGPTVIAWFDRSTKLICNSYIGSVYPLLTTATGRAFLAYLPGETAMNHVKYELGLGPDESLPASLKKRIQAIQASVRERGLGTVDGDVIPGLSAFGVPTFDIQGRIATVIGVISESNSLTGQKGEKVARALLAAGADVTRSQGFVPGLDSPRSYAQWLDGVWANALVTSQSTEAEGPRRRRRQNSGTSIPVG